MNIHHAASDFPLQSNPYVLASPDEIENAFAAEATGRREAAALLSAVPPGLQEDRAFEHIPILMRAYASLA